MQQSKEVKKVFAFPTRSACKHCGTIDTITVSTADKVQYRQCRRIGCRRTYTVIGTFVKHTEKEQEHEQEHEQRPKTKCRAKTLKTIKRKPAKRKTEKRAKTSK